MSSVFRDSCTRVQNERCVTAHGYGLRLTLTVSYGLQLRLTVTYGLRTTTFHLERGELKESIVK